LTTRRAISAQIPEFGVRGSSDPTFSNGEPGNVFQITFPCIN